jgi:rSAM/selenodomain-associated transferase 1
MIAAVALMLKAPREGQVKTRLALAAGAGEAARIYRRLVEWQIARIPRDWSTQIHFTPTDASNEMQDWLGPGHSYCPQADGDLGARLGFAMHSHFAVSHIPLVFLGGDCPYLTTSRLGEVSALLRETDSVLIPALDGGYCLLALRRPAERIFSAIAWSTDTVAEETRRRLRNEGIAWKELQQLEDVDDEASWARAKLALPDLDA